MPFTQPEASPNVLKKWFPDLDSYFWKRHSDCSGIYNCIAYAVGDTHNWWSPLPRSYWPQGLLRAETVEAYTEAFKTKGFDPCANGTLEIGFDKIVLYLLNDVPCHAARQVSFGEYTGFWVSKLGGNIDIIHEKPESLSGNEYGVPTHYFKKDLSAYQEMIKAAQAQKLIDEKKGKKLEKKERYEAKKKKKKKH